MEDRILKMSRLAIEVTNICNAKCQFCAYRFLKRPKRTLTNGEFRFFIEKYVEYGGGELKLTPIVGDALTDKDLIEKIKIAKEYQKITHLYLYTNLIGLSQFDIKEFLNSGIDKIDVSTCLSGRETYKRLYGVDKYDEVLVNLKKLFQVNLEECGNKVKIDIIIRGEKLDGIPIIGPDYDYFVKEYRYHPRIIENYDNWTGLITEKDLPEGQKFREIVDMSKPCSLFYKGLIILANGSVGACWCRDLEGTLIVGNIYKNTLSQIWQGKKLQKLRDDWEQGKIPEVCKNCYQYTAINK